jgi:hypothetical protein
MRGLSCRPRLNHPRRRRPHRRHRRQDPAGPRPIPRHLRLRNRQRDLAQGREPAAHRRIQDSRRGQQDSAAHSGRDRPRRHHLFQRQPRPGRGLCRPRGRRKSRHRHALERPGHQARRHAGPRRGSGGRRPGLQRAPGRGREAGARARLRRHSALRRRADHRRPGHLRPRDRRRACPMWTWCWPRSPAAACSAAWPRPSSSSPPCQGLRRRARAGRRHGGELSHRKNRHLARRAHQPHHRRRPAHPKRGRAQLRPHPGLVDGIITVTEAEIRAAMRAIVAATRLVPEPSGAVAAAALLFHAAELPPYTKAVAVVSGGNVDPALLAEVLTESRST